MFVCRLKKEIESLRADLARAITAQQTAVADLTQERTDHRRNVDGTCSITLRLSWLRVYVRCVSL